MGVNQFAFTPEIKAEAVRMRIVEGIRSEVVAERFKTTRTTVNRWCKQAGTPAKKDQFDPNKFNWVEADALMGVISDRAIARKFDLNPATVFSRRRRLEIPSYRSYKRHPAPRSTVVGQLLKGWGRSKEVAEHSRELKRVS